MVARPDKTRSIVIFEDRVMAKSSREGGRLLPYVFWGYNTHVLSSQYRSAYGACSGIVMKDWQMMNAGEHIIGNAADAQALAARIFTLRYPDQDSFFNISWRIFGQKKENEVFANVLSPGSDFAAAGTPDTMAIDMAREVAIFFESFMAKFPIAQTELIGSLERVCRKYGKEQEYIQDVKGRVESVSNRNVEFLVWVSTPSGIGSKQLSYTEKALNEKVLPNMDRYDIAVKGRSVLTRTPTGHHYLQMEEKPYKLLVILLRYKEEHLDTRDLYMRVYGLRHPVDYSEAEIVERFLKFPISDLRAKMVKVRGFIIPDKLHSGGYRCAGDFTFGIVIDKCLENAFRVRACSGEARE